MSDIEAILNLHARGVYTDNQLIAALTLADATDHQLAAHTAFVRTVHIEPSPLLTHPWETQP